MSQMSGSIQLLRCSSRRVRVLLSTFGVLAVSVAFATCSNCTDDVTFCNRINLPFNFVCCVDNDGDQVYHCADCVRYYYQCPGGTIKFGAPENCTNPGETCTP